MEDAAEEAYQWQFVANQEDTGVSDAAEWRNYGGLVSGLFS